MIDVTALGELLIDFTPAGISEAGNVLFERNPGGAPANVLVALSRLGGSGAFLGMVGNDQFGGFLEGVLKDNGINTSGLKFSRDVNTTLAFVHLNERGDRSFSFYRKPGADTCFSEEDIEFNIIRDSRIFHFGSLSLTNEPSRNATIKAVEYAKKNEILVSYDPNLRRPLWESEEHAREGMLLGLRYADILKISEEEMEFLTGEGDVERGSKVLLDMGIKLVAVTLGDRGSYYRNMKANGYVKGYRVNTIDTTGAGDAFTGALLKRLCDLKLMPDELGAEQLEDMIMYSNAYAALSTTKKGAIPSMPTICETNEFLLRCRLTGGKND